ISPVALARPAVRVRPPSEHHSRYYLRVTVSDQAGVLAKIAGALGDNGVSIASMVQFEADVDAGTAELVFTTHRAQGGSLATAITQVASMDVVREIGNVLPIDGQGGPR